MNIIGLIHDNDPGTLVWFSDHYVVPFLEFADIFQQRFRWFEPFSFDVVERDREKGRFI